MRSARSEAGFALIEVVVSAAVLAIVALAVLSGIDGANGASAREKARAVAANLAEQDQERLRAMPVEMLQNPPQADPITVDGVTYTIKSEARWITDDLGGEPGCGSATNQTEYMQIRTTVTSNIVGTGKRVSPVTIDSLVAPTQKWVEGHGTLAVKVVDRTGTKGVPGINVAAVSGSFSPPQTQTDANGCAVFKSVPVGTYTVRLNTPGYVNREGNQLSEEEQAVVAKTINVATMAYDQATSARATVTTHPPGATWSAANAKPSKARHVSLTNGAVVGLHRTLSPSVSPGSVVEADGLFPFIENDYSLFTGACRYASPDVFHKDYYTQINPDAALKADPAQAQPQQVSVRQPPLNIRIMRRYQSGQFSDGDVSVYLKLQKPASANSDDCSEPTFQLTTKGWPGGTWGNPPRSSITGTNENHFVSWPGTGFDPGLPFGKYKICLRDERSSRGAVWSGEYDNTSPNGWSGANVDINISSGSWTSGQRCTNF